MRSILTLFIAVIITPLLAQESVTLVGDLQIMDNDLSVIPEEGKYVEVDVDGQKVVLYDYETALQLAPLGWRLPHREEFNKFIEVNGRDGLYGKITSGELDFKSTGKTGLQLGEKHTLGQGDPYIGSYYWCTPQHDEKSAFIFGMHTFKDKDMDNIVSTGTLPKSSLLSVRYIREHEVFTDSRDNRKYRAYSAGGHTVMIDNFAYKAGTGEKTPLSTEEEAQDPNVYGYHYTLDQAMELAPEGWHLPTKEEFESFLAAIGFDSNTLYEVKKDHPFDIKLAGFTNNYDMSAYFGLTSSFWTQTLDKKDKYYSDQAGESTPASIKSKKKENYFSVLYFKD